MDYVDIINRTCPVEIQAGVADLEKGAQNEVEDAAFHYIGSMALELDCAIAVTGYLAQNITRQTSVSYKISFQSVASRYARDFKAAGPDVFGPMQREVERALRVNLDDIRTASFRGRILSLLASYEINLLTEVRVYEDDRVLGKGFSADWELNQHALCMGDVDAVDRLRRILAGGGPQDLRLTFATLRYSNPCIPTQTLAELVRPSLQDDRATFESGAVGLPVSHYARELLDSL